MPSSFSPEQLERWSRPVAPHGAVTTYLDVTTALLRELPDFTFDTFLQGSIPNRTNVAPAAPENTPGDIDVVVRLTAEQSWSGRPEQYKRWAEFRAATAAALEKRYGPDQIELAAKCIKVAPDAGRLAIDVVPCVTPDELIGVLPGHVPADAMTFWLPERDDEQVTSFPVPHQRRNGERAETTGGQNLRAIRVLKQLRPLVLEDDVADPAAAAPSYFIDCAVNNVPATALHGTDVRTAVLRTADYMLTADPQDLVTTAGGHPLYGDTACQWNPEDAGLFFSRVRQVMA